MSYNGSGTFNLVAGNPVVTSTTISSTWANNTMSDLATGLSTAITKDGQTTPTANIPMGGFKLTGLGVGTLAGDAMRAGDAQTQVFTAFTTGGTSTAYTLSPTPAITAYAANQSFFVKFNAASGAAPTLTISGVATPPNLVKQNGDGTYSNIADGEITINHRSRVTLLSATQAWVEVLPIKLTSGTVQASTSGTSIDFTGIPAGVKRVTLSVVAVSTSGTANPFIQLGDSGGIETAGYTTNASFVDGAPSSFTGAFALPTSSAANVIHGSIVFTLVDSSTNTWVGIGNFMLSNTLSQMFTMGSKSLSGALDRVRFTTNGGVDTFDGGSMNILYE